jgi:UDP-N-acetylmuramyl pentapeptide synthase
MFLTLGDLANLFPKTTGMKDEFQFCTVSTDSTLSQPRGLFIPLFKDSGELKDAIQNGAIGAIWDEQEELPLYIPNHFPIFYTNNLVEALEQIMKAYVDKLNGETNEIMNMTKFLFIEEKLLNNAIPSYDIPVSKFVNKKERRG